MLTTADATSNQAILFLTDVEGNLNYFNHWINGCDLISFDNGSGNLVFNNDHSRFVYGGDVTDKGYGDLSILKRLIDFKERYPDRVFLLTGNRDINKIRFTQELDSRHIVKRCFKILSGELLGILIGDNAKLKDKYITALKASLKENVGEDYGKYYDTNPETLIIRKFQLAYLKWMLVQNMGCGPNCGARQGAFDLRKIELANQKQTQPDTISDEIALASFLQQVSPEGLETRYLNLAQIGVILNDTLFLHGAITQTNMGRIPGEQETATDIHKWVNMLNAWYRRELKKWLSHPSLDEIQPCGYGPLNFYALEKDPTSVVYADWFQKDKSILPINNNIIEFANKGSIKRIITGHQPFGEFPLILREDPNIEVITCDTSYSDKTTSDNRGQAISWLKITFTATTSQSILWGVRANGESYQLELPAPGMMATQEKPSLYGRRFNDNQWIGVKNKTGEYILRKPEINGYNIFSNEISEAEVKKKFNQEDNRTKKIFVMDFDGTITVNEPIIEPDTATAIRRMRGLNLNDLRKVLSYLSEQGHYVILGSLKSLWNQAYEDRYFRIHGRRNTGSAYDPVTFTQFRERMHAFLDHHYTEQRSFCSNNDIDAYDNFAWNEDLILRDKNQLLDCARDFVAQHRGFTSFRLNQGIPENEINKHVILIDDHLGYKNQLARGYSFIHADVDHNNAEFNNSYLVKMLVESIEMPEENTPNFSPRIFQLSPNQPLGQNVNALENTAIIRLEQIETINDRYMEDYIIPLKRAYINQAFPAVTNRPTP